MWLISFKKNSSRVFTEWMQSIGRLFAEDRLMLNNGVHIHLKLSVYLLNRLVLFCFVFQSTPLLITTFAAFGFMVLLAWFKYLIAYKVDSRALRTDGKPTLSHLSHYWSHYLPHDNILIKFFGAYENKSSFSKWVKGSKFPKNVWCCVGGMEDGGGGGVEQNNGSISVSGQLPTYPSPSPTLTLTCYQLTVVELGEG